MDLQHVIVHKLIKLSGVTGAENVTIKKKNTEFDVNNEKVISLTKQIKETYTNKSGLGYGDFEKGVGMFEQKLSQFHKAQIDFINFTLEAMTQLKNAIKNKSLATGGYLLFFIYKEDGASFLIIAMLKNKGQFDFDDDLNLKDVQTIDLNHLHIAARFNFNKWVGNGEHYISFVKGISKDVTDYFKSFIGIDDANYTDSKENTGDLYTATTDYCEKRSYTMETENSIRQRLYDLATEKHKSGQPITIQEIANIIDPEDPERFVAYANSDECNLPGEIHIDKKEARKLVNISGGDNLVHVRFSTEALDKNRVTFDIENDYIMINGIPDDIKKHLRMYEKKED
ncbi:nucleoid-associated protein [Desulforegula conservatrix]|uniref:nucleoid-associated protein n=1 Tax=Desulforegula conservatrix TaxID=153026 RepID=UPI0004224D0A|nr:nucleoid-associated protein [Desulforegula conservatrix]